MIKIRSRDKNSDIKDLIEKAELLLIKLKDRKRDKMVDDESMNQYYLDGVKNRYHISD